MTYTKVFRPLSAACLLTLSSAMSQAAPMYQWLSTGDVAQSPQLGAINLTDMVYLLGNASVDYSDDAPLGAGALNQSGNNPVDAASLSSTLGVPGALFDNEAQGQFTYEGSALFNTVAVQAGDTLSFDWRLFGQVNNGPAPVPDTAWLVLGQTAVKLSDVDSLSTITNNWLDSGVQHIDHTFTQAGLVKIGFVVADVNSYDTTSVLAIQNINLTPAVPEPEGIALVLTGLVILGRAARRSHQS